MIKGPTGKVHQLPYGGYGNQTPFWISHINCLVGIMLELVQVRMDREAMLEFHWWRDSVHLAVIPA